MITWMQRHRKYLVVTIWISSIAFVGAGFMGWGQYSYGDKAGAIAKVGEVSISNGDLQKSYSRLYQQYNKMFQGNFDEAQAKSFGLQQQAFKQLVNQALIKNMALDYQLRVNDQELLAEITSQEMFFENGAFSKEIYNTLLSQNNMTMKEYESDVRDSMLITKIMKMFNPETLEFENEALESAMFISDKVNYKILTSDMISIDGSKEAVKAYWENSQMNYLSEINYDIEIIKTAISTSSFTDTEVQEFYNINKNDYTDAEGAILSLELAKSQIVAALNEKASNKTALKQYIAFKKAKLDESTQTEKLNITPSNTVFGSEIFSEIEALNLSKPYLKPRKIDNGFVTIKLIAKNEANPKTFEQAYDLVKVDHARDEKLRALEEMATNSVNTFNGTTTGFLTREDGVKLKDLNAQESALFLNSLFESEKKRGKIVIDENKVVIFNILEQKLLQDFKHNQGSTTKQIKSAMLEAGLIKLLSGHYKTEKFVEGL